MGEHFLRRYLQSDAPQRNARRARRAGRADDRACRNNEHRHGRHDPDGCVRRRGRQLFSGLRRDGRAVRDRLRHRDRAVLRAVRREAQERRVHNRLRAEYIRCGRDGIPLARDIRPVRHLGLYRAAPADRTHPVYRGHPVPRRDTQRQLGVYLYHVAAGHCDVAVHL